MDRKELERRRRIRIGMGWIGTLRLWCRRVARGVGWWKGS